MQCHPCVTLMKCTFASLKVCDLKQIYYKVNELCFANQRLLLECDVVTPPSGCITVNQSQNGCPVPPRAKRIQRPLFTIRGCCCDCCPFIYRHLENRRLALQSGPTISAGKDLRSAYRPIARVSQVAQW